MRRRFAGKTVLVTGGAAGLGRCIALRFARAGAWVWALDRDAEAVSRFGEEARRLGLALDTALCDVADFEQCRAAVDEISGPSGGVDVLVNNAGISHRSAFRATDAAVLRRVIEVNLMGSIHMTHTALPGLIARRGLIIVLSSVAGIAPLIARTGYAASKHALHGFFGSLRTELRAEGVGVLMVCPSFIATGIERHALGPDGKPVGRKQEIVGRRTTPEVVADRIFRAAERDRRLLLPDAVARASYWMARLLPRLYEAIMVRKLRGELGEGG